MKGIVKGGFTLTELTIAVTITVLILGGLLKFVSDSLGEIASSTKVSELMAKKSKIHEDIRIKMNLYPNIEHVLDQGNEDGADVLLLTNIEEDEAIMYTLVDPVTKKMHSSNDFKLYNKKHIGEKVLTLAELNAIQSNPASAANYVFFDDKIYRDLFINNFQLEMFASGAIADLQVRAYAQYDEALQREQLETKVLGDENIYTFTLNF